MCFGVELSVVLVDVDKGFLCEIVCVEVVLCVLEKEIV